MRQIITMHTKITAEWKVNGPLVIGLFDGVHLGHQELIQEAKKDQREITCLTFSSSMAHSIAHKSGGSSLLMKRPKTLPKKLSSLFFNPSPPQGLSLGKTSLLERISKGKRRTFSL